MTLNSLGLEKSGRGEGWMDIRKAEQRAEEQQDWGSTKQDERNRTWVDHGDKKGNRQDDTLASLLKIRISDNETSRDSLRMNYAHDACMKAIKSM